MKRRNFLALLGGSSVAGSMALSSGAFSSTRADRSTEVAIVGDDGAYLTLDFPQNTQNLNCSVDLSVTIQNRTSQPLDALNVMFSTGVGSLDGLSTSGPGSYTVDTTAGTVSLDSGSLDPGEAVTITAAVAGFSGKGTTDFGFGVTASGESITVTTTTDRTVELGYDCPTAPGRSLSVCPRSSVQPPDISVPQSPCEPLEFTQANLPPKDSIGLSQGPKDVREELSNESGIEIEDKIEDTVTGDDRDDPLRVLSDKLSSGRISVMPDNPSSNQTFKLGGSNPQARVGRTTGDDIANLPVGVTLKNFSTVVGELDVSGAFKLKGGSAVAGDVTTETVEEIKNSLLLGSLKTTNGDDSVSITGEAVVCGSVDAAGSIAQIKQSRIDGFLRADGDISEINEATVTGDVTTAPGSDGDISVKESSLIDGDVDAAGTIEAEGSEVTGKLEADGDISTVKQSDVGGEVRTAQGSSGDISIEESNVGGPITADGDIPELKSVSKVGGPVEAGSVISAIKTSTVDGSVTAPDISQLEGVEINGNVTATDGANKDITVKSNNGESVICGNVVSTNGRVEKIKNSKVNGSVEAAQVGTLKGSNTEIGRSVRTTDQSADLEINGATVYGVVDAAGSIPEIKDSRVEGSVTAGGNVNVNESKVCTEPGTGLETKATVDTGKVKIKSSSTVSGPVDAAGPIEAVKGSTVKGNVDSDDKVKKIKDATVKGDVTADDKVGVIEQSTVEGSLTSGGKVEEVKQSTVEGSLTADGRVKVNDSDVCTDPNTNLDTTNGGPVKIESDSTVGGPISADGSIETIKDSTVKGDVMANGDVKLEGSTEIQGDVTSNGGTITPGSNVTITGKTTENP